MISFPFMVDRVFSRQVFCSLSQSFVPQFLIYSHSLNHLQLLFLLFLLFLAVLGCFCCPRRLPCCKQFNPMTFLFNQSPSNANSDLSELVAREMVYATMLLDEDQAKAHADNCSVDRFDLLPDPIVSLILNKIGDVKVLGRCAAVSKRFQNLTRQVDNVVVKVDCVITGEDSGLSVKGKSLLSCFVRLFLGILAKQFQALQHWMVPRRFALSQVAHHSPRDVLKNFKAIQHLRLELPAGELGMEKGTLLKWKAEFGSTLESCTILAAASCENKTAKADGYSGPNTSEQSPLGSDRTASEDTDILPESFYTDGGLKLRVVWTISSLIAASARHFLLKQIISEHPTLESLVLSDSDGQGLLCMCKRQLREFCEKPSAKSPSSSRTQVPALNLRLCYAARLDLPGGVNLEGATLVMIKPVDQPPCSKDSDNFVSHAFEEPYRSAVRALLKKRTYCLEMNSF